MVRFRRTSRDPVGDNGTVGDDGPPAAQPEQDLTQTQQLDSSSSIFPTFIFGFVILIVTSVTFSFHFVPEWGKVFSVLATLIALGGSAVTVGGFFGFIFAVPRIPEPDTTAGAPDKPAVRPNSNLEQISDWLTKILVGVGLVELQNLPGAVERLGIALYEPLGASESSSIMGLSTLLFSFATGFTLMYMWTRTRFLEVVKHYESGVGGGKGSWGSIRGRGRKGKR